MRLLIVTPAPSGSTKGNRITAERWASLLRRLGHYVEITDGIEAGEFDCLISLHATRSHNAIKDFQKQFPGRPVILCLTGTDLHRDWLGRVGESVQQKSAQSMNSCDYIVLLEPESARLLSPELQSKVSVIRQSAQAIESNEAGPLAAGFKICVVGHLREEKDPFLVATASRRLPARSKISIAHVGEALSPSMEKQAISEMESSPRYCWLGVRSHEDAQRMIASSDLFVLTSKIEGAPSVISEAIVNHTPILATRIPATIGLLGRNYPGLFPVGDAHALCEMLLRAECDSAYLAQLTLEVKQLSRGFSPEAELLGLQQLLMKATGK